MIPAGLIPREPTLDSHNELVALGDHRVERAEMRLHAARQEVHDAVFAAQSARAARAAWLTAHPQPQIEMFER